MCPRFLWQHDLAVDQLVVLGGDLVLQEQRLGRGGRRRPGKHRDGLRNLGRPRLPRELGQEVVKLAVGHPQGESVAGVAARIGGGGKDLRALFAWKQQDADYTEGSAAR